MQFTVKEKATGKPVTSSSKTFKRFKKIGNADQESLWVLGLSKSLIESYCECLFKGGIASCSFDPVIIFKRLIVNNCSAFIIIHNHPSGSVAPSSADNLTVKRLHSAGELLEISLVDSLIIGEKTYYSFKEEGIL